MSYIAIRDSHGRCMKGSESPMKGKKHTKETKMKMALQRKGKHFSLETEIKKGAIPWNKGVHYDRFIIDESILRNYYLNENNTLLECAIKFGCKSSLPIKKALNKYGIPIRKTTVKKDREYNAWNKGKKTPREIVEKMRKSRLGKYAGEKHWNWRGGITTENRIARTNTEFRNWREAVFKRDNYTCQYCHDRSGNGHQVELHPHHIKSFAKYKTERFNISNGITLCYGCHRYVHSIDILSQQ